MKQMFLLDSQCAFYEEPSRLEAIGHEAASAGQPVIAFEAMERGRFGAHVNLTKR